MADDLRKHLAGVTPPGDAREVRHPSRLSGDEPGDPGGGSASTDVGLASDASPAAPGISVARVGAPGTAAATLRSALAVVDAAVAAARTAAQDLTADGDRTTLSELLADLPAGPGLAALLDAVDPDAVSDADVVDLVAAGVRVESWAHARTTQAAAALARRSSMNPTWSEQAGGAPAVACVAGDELAMRLGWSRRAATRLVRHGQAMPCSPPVTPWPPVSWTR